MALGGATSYGAVPVFAKLAFLNSVPALETVLARTLAILVALAGAAIVLKQSFRVPRAAWSGFALQVVATASVSLCYMASVQFIPVPLSVIIFYMFPIMILLAAPLAEGRAPSRQRFAVAGLAFFGLAIAIGPRFESLDIRGILLGLAAAVGCATQFFAGRSAAKHIEAAPYASLVHIAILPVVVLALWYFASTDLVMLDQKRVGQHGVLAVAVVSVAYVFGYFLHMSALRAAPASVVAPYFNMEPIIVTVLAMLVLGEKLSTNQIVGSLVMIAALLAGGVLERKQTA